MLGGISTSSSLRKNPGKRCSDLLRALQPTRKCIMQRRGSRLGGGIGLSLRFPGTHLADGLLANANKMIAQFFLVHDRNG